MKGDDVRRSLGRTDLLSECFVAVSAGFYLDVEVHWFPSLTLNKNITYHHHTI